MESSITTIIQVVAALGAVATTLIVARTLRQALRQRRWLETKAEIVASSVSARLSPRSGDGPSSQLRRQFRPEIRFIYEVDGQRYEGSTYSLFINESSDDREAAAVVAQYAVGSTTTAYFDPHDPSQAVLDRSIRWLSLIVMMGVAGVFATVALVGWRWQ